MISNIYNKFRRITSNQLYFPEIDGIRFLAIILVILFHVHGYFQNKSPFPVPAANLLDTFLTNSDRGVEFFFVLSGFILCLPFAHQYINKGKKVSLKKYYLRRITRLEPPYIIALTGIGLLQVATGIHPLGVLVPHWLASLVYMHDIIYDQVPMITVVAWSLEIEIQFYVLAPLFFHLLSIGKFWRRFIIITSIIITIFLQSQFDTDLLTILEFLQYFLAGLLLADLYVSDTASGLFSKPWMASLALPCFIILMYLPLKNVPLPAILMELVKLAFVFFTVILYYLIFKNRILKAIFSFGAMPIIGGMCYSIYLLHYTIISFFGKYTLRLHITNQYFPNLFLQIAILFIPILLISSLFYYYIERPFMSGKWVDMLLKKNKRAETTNAVS